jgi:hypothetical protein
MQNSMFPWKSLLAVAVFVGLASAQPTNPPTTGDLLCTVDTSATARLDTLESTRDADGFLSLFNGTSFKGWWQNCRTSHSSGDQTNGAIFRVDQARNWIYSTQRGSVGGILTTKKRYSHYEIVFETWPGYGNDGGLFNRPTTGGACYQTVLDYINDASYGGSYGEGGFVGRDQRPSKIVGNDSTLTIPGNTFSGNSINWTTITAAATARGEATGCPSTGCTQATWRQTWKMSSAADGWNTVRIKFYGGLSRTQSASGDKIHMKSYYRSKLDLSPTTRVDSMQWVMFFTDSLVLSSTQAASWGNAGPIGIQVHGGGRFPAARGTWYRNIRVRELDSLGNPTGVPVSIGTVPNKKADYALRAVAGSLTGQMDLDHQVVVSDLSGRVVDTFFGKAGKVNYTLTTQAKGLLVAEIRTERGVGHLRFKVAE